MKVSLLLLKTSLSSCSGSYTLSPPPGLDYSVSMQTRFCFPSTKNKKQLPSLPHPLAATSFPFHSKPCLHLLSTYLVTSPSLLLLFHLIFCPYCFSEAVLISQGLQWPSMLSNPMDIFYLYWAQPLSPPIWLINLSLKYSSPSPHSTTFSRFSLPLELLLPMGSFPGSSSPTYL